MLCLLLIVLLIVSYIVPFLYLQAYGIANGNDRSLLKKKIKDMKSNIERERKLQEKERKARERLELAASRDQKKKKGLFGKS